MVFRDEPLEAAHCCGDNVLIGSECRLGAGLRTSSMMPQVTTHRSEPLQVSGLRHLGTKRDHTHGKGHLVFCWCVILIAADHIVASHAAEQRADRAPVC